MINAYVLVGYALIWASLLLYAWRLERRLRNVRGKLGAMPRGADTRDLHEP